MSLGLSAYHVAGEFSPRIEFNSKSGRMNRVDRTADGSDIIRVDLTMTQPVLAFDLGTIEIGWIKFQNGAPPTFLVVPYGQPMPQRPEHGYKAGFRAKVWEGVPGTVAREFSATAGATVKAIEVMHDLLTTNPEAAAGKVPVIRLVNVEPIASQRGTNYAPVFNLLQWIDRNEAVFGPRTVAAPGGAPILAMVPAAAQPAPITAVASAWPVAAIPAPTPAAWPTTPSQKAA